MNLQPIETPLPMGHIPNIIWIGQLHVQLIDISSFYFAHEHPLDGPHLNIYDHPFDVNLIVCLK